MQTSEIIEIAGIFDYRTGTCPIGTADAVYSAMPTRVVLLLVSLLAVLLLGALSVEAQSFHNVRASAT
jgi:hypothetical protein